MNDRQMQQFFVSSSLFIILSLRSFLHIFFLLSFFLLMSIFLCLITSFFLFFFFFVLLRFLLTSLSVPNFPALVCHGKRCDPLSFVPFPFLSRFSVGLVIVQFVCFDCFFKERERESVRSKRKASP